MNRAALGAIDLYQATASPRMPSVGVRCRFEPTCSRYAEAALRARGIFAGGARAAWRVLRCGPWTARGTVDPPPPATSRSLADEAAAHASLTGPRPAPASGEAPR
ncbi:MAG: membrane protein insertion efficiency factor YidD [Acidobacteria bacterium]|nr:MAG: membrane protein insertion efficiency factor YidD [Acidobacteriota bacterium]REK07425.1 MAG: membrane protein insertion efficiency factor YidD [Acidobacteriota bacterium]